jgi:coenzyme PQQ precursor peptide PqqA
MPCAPVLSLFICILWQAARSPIIGAEAVARVINRRTIFYSAPEQLANASLGQQRWLDQRRRQSHAEFVRFFHPRRAIMAWKTPKIVEVSVGMEINMYACAARK